jgi:hypothetical protein
MRAGRACLGSIGIAIAVLSAGTLTGCAANYGTTSDARFQFSASVPSGVSSAWRQGDSVWLVPARNTYIESAKDEAGQSVPIKAEGAYLRLVSSSRTFTLRVRGESEMLLVP